MRVQNADRAGLSRLRAHARIASRLARPLRRSLPPQSPALRTRRVRRRRGAQSRTRTSARICDEAVVRVGSGGGGARLVDPEESVGGTRYAVRGRRWSGGGFPPTAYRPPPTKSSVIVEPGPLSDRLALLELLGLKIAVDRRYERDDGAAGTARDEQQNHIGDDGHDAFGLLTHDDVADAAGQQQVQHENQNRIFRRSRRVNEVTAGAGRRAARRRGRGWWW